MGRPYAKELAALGHTYEWALAAPISDLAEFVRDAAGLPLIAVGSGGSATAAHFAALLHRVRGSGFARHSTPLELVLSEPNIHKAAILLLSASGKNRDVLGALDRCIHLEARALATVCTHAGSPLASQARRYNRARVLEVDAPGGKDGFLATNSLLATCVFIARAYRSDLRERFGDERPPAPLEALQNRDMAIVLHGGWGSPVATDLESKLNESAIAAAMVTDYRNFGHGRHLWLARRAPESFVVMLVSPETSEVAARTRALLPRDVPVVELRTDADGPAATLDLLVQAFRLVGRLGELQDFDPGRPSVPQFGRRLYHLKAPELIDDDPPPITRKLAHTARLGWLDRDELRAALVRFVEDLAGMRLSGLVLDYDGTLCGPTERFGDLRADIAAECCRLLQGGLNIGLATGRGRSVRIAMQKAIPRELWHRVLVGYYNGGEMASLESNEAPARDVSPEAPLDVAYEHLKADALLNSVATLTARRYQITVEPRREFSTDALMSHVMTALALAEQLGVRVLASSHSVDVLAPGISKLAVVQELQRRTVGGGEVLCIGDRGAWPGNDCALLSHSPSLSVDEVSGSLRTCWNIAAPGMLGVEVALRYLRALSVSDGEATIDARDFWRSP